MATSAVTSTSNFDVNSIVSQLMAVERQPIDRLNVKEAGYQAKLSAYGTIQGAMGSFQTALQGLTSASKFQALSATPSDATVFSASASSIAVPDTYSLEVTSLAQAQKLAATGQTSSTDTIGSGAETTLTFDFGTISGGSFDTGTGKYTGASFTSNGSGTKNVTIDSSNNTLQGIRDAINAAGVGVTATIINDGSGTPYRLALSSGSYGVENSMKITVSGDATVSDLLAHDPADNAGQNLAETVTAQNADFKVNGVAVSKASNTVSDVIQGITLTLSKVTATPATLTVARDTASISSSVSSFVDAYNELAATLKTVSAYDTTSQKGAILQGDATVRSLQSQLRSIIGTAVVGTPGTLTMLSDVGVSFQKDGSLALDQSKLNNAINNHFDDVASLFASVGRPTDSLVTFNNAISTTKAGSYAVNVTQIATQGKSVGFAAITTPLDIVASSNDTLDLIVNGTSASITLTAGTYNTAQELATELQTQINSDSTLSAKNVSVIVSESGGVLTITSSNYGSTSSVVVSSGSAETDLGLNGDTSTSGLDVAGSIGGAAATGSGQLLSAIGGDPSGMSIIVAGGTTGDRGTLYYSNGYASLLNSWATSSLSTDGILASRTEGIGRTITDIGKQRSALETRLISVERGYRIQFTALDAMLSSMNTTSTYLTQQLEQLAKL